MIKFVLNRGLSRPLFYSRVPAMEHLPPAANTVNISELKIVNKSIF